MTPAHGGTSDVAIARSPELTGFETRYRLAMAEFLAEGLEEGLMAAYDLARQALAAGMSLTLFQATHHAAAQRLRGAAGDPEQFQQRVELFVMEFISVYDMALQGYQRTMPLLQHEITERHRAEAELRAATAALERQRDSLDAEVFRRTHELAEKAEHLEQALAQLTQTNREQAAFTYAISHDLKSPSNTIAMLLNELKFGYRDLLDGDGRELIELALQTTARMGRLVDDVLTYSRCIEDQGAMDTVDLDDVLAEVTADLRYDLGKTAARIRHDALPRVQGFRMQIKLLLQNLVANAVKFRDPARAPEITISHRAGRGGRILLSVQDNGIGIAPEFHERVFGLFQRLHSHESYEGSGIGLALSKRIVANHGGDIRLQSHPGQGSTFTISLKRAAS